MWQAGRTMLAGLACLVVAGSAGIAAAQTCGIARDVRDGDTLYSLAQEVYGDAQQWPNLYFANQPLLSGRRMQVVPGDVLFVPCLSDEDPAQSAAPFDQGPSARLWLPDSDPPFSGRRETGGGLIGRMISEALLLSSEPIALDWADGVEDGDMILIRDADDCDTLPGGCADWHVSEPVLSVPTMMFRNASAASATTSADLCDPAPSWTNAAPGVQRCLRALAQGKAAGFAADALTAGAAIAAAGLKGQIIAETRPVGDAELRIAVPRAHWRGTTLVFRVNEGLAVLRETGRYDALLAASLARYWQEIGPSAAHR